MNDDDFDEAPICGQCGLSMRLHDYEFGPSEDGEGLVVRFRCWQ